MSPAGRAITGVGALALGGALAIGGLEAALRLLDLRFEPVWQSRGYHRLDARLFYAHRPGAAGVWETPEFSEERAVNGLGLRGEEVSLEKAPGVARILHLGDSVTYGHGVSLAQSYPEQTEARLGAAGLRTESVNAGTAAYNTDQSYRLFLERLRPLKPDVLVFNLNVNDVEWNAAAPLYGVEGGRLVPYDPKRSPFFWALVLGRNEFLADRSLLFNRAVRGLMYAGGAARLWRMGEKGLRDWSLEKIGLELEHLDALGREDGYRLCVVNVLNPRALPGGPQSGLYAGLAARLAARPIPYVDLNQRLDPGERGRVFYADGHPNAGGHRIMGEMVAEFLRRTVLQKDRRAS